ncbi:MAG: HAMP domain-containing histidine kinase [Alphaproteobacteria bacterium]|nr:HAMP domain-containing histidine kinase [Alphaproteobacteria bacterium]
MSAFGLSAAGVAVYFILTAALLAGLVWQLNRVFVADVMETLSAEMRTLTAIENTAEPGAMERTVAGIARQTNKRLYFLSASDGRKLAGNLAEFPPELAAGGAGGLFTYAFEKGPQAGERNAAGISVSLAGGGKLVVARDIEDQRRFVASIRLLALAAFALIAIGGLGLGILASRTALRRVESISDATRRIMAGEFSGRLPLQGSGDEFDRLSNSVNEMLVRIEDLMHGLKEVSDNIAHDLKTPLNRLRQRAEASLRSAGTADELRAGLGDTIEAADEIIKTFNALLLIARLEAGAVEETKTAIALAPVLADAAELYEPVAEEAGIRLFMGEICNVTLSANRHLIGQAVVNLIDNAIKYGRQSEPETTSGRARRDDRESRIELSLCLEHGRAIITVADNGPGISASDRKRAMERFVRLDKSRSLPGTGLGLSLVAAVARLHGGELRLEDNEPGLRAVLILPV